MVVVFPCWSCVCYAARCSALSDVVAGMHVDKIAILVVHATCDSCLTAAISPHKSCIRISQQLKLVLEGGICTGGQIH